MMDDQLVDQEDNKECYVAERDSNDNDNDVENRNLKPTKDLCQVREGFPDETSSFFFHKVSRYWKLNTCRRLR
jgi:hypothetical protein